jgi:hypothetical protein
MRAEVVHAWAAGCGHCSRTVRGDWLVTAPQKQVRLRSGRREPWGQVHLRRDGATVSACGRPAGEWFVFWDQSFSPTRPDACRECARVWWEDTTGRPG